MLKIRTMISVFAGLVPAIALASTIAMVIPGSAAAQIRGEIVGAGQQQMPIAIPDLKRMVGPVSTEAATFIRVLRDDLAMSGMFRVLSTEAHPKDAQLAGTSLLDIDFDAWNGAGARGLVRGRYSSSEAGMNLEVRFFDVPGKAMLGGRKFGVTASNAARVAHRMADAVIDFVTGTPGPFDSRIAFISNREGHHREVNLFSFDRKIDQVTQHRSLTMSPSWHPDMTSLVFTSFRGGRPSLYSVHLNTGDEVRLARKLGLNVGGAWAPDGSLLALAREDGGNTDVYALDFAGQKQWKLTEHWGIDVAPAWSPDSKKMAFCSSRSGGPQIYVMNVTDRSVQRLTFHGKYNCAPAWSPDGRSIAYSGQVGSNFQLFVIPTEGGEPRQLTFQGSNEDPTWSPDSRFLAYSSKRGGLRKLFLTDVTGRWQRQLTHGTTDDSSPSWSRRLD